MADVLKKALTALDRIYKFRSGQAAPQRMDLDSAITVVHDVSREAEIGVGELFLAGVDNSHAAANTQEGQFDPYTTVDGLFGENSGMVCWLLSCWTTMNGGLFTEASITVNYVPWKNNIPRRDRMIAFYSGIESIADQGVAPATYPYAGVSGANGGVTVLTEVPVIVPPGSNVSLLSKSAGAIVVRGEALFWAGPEGVLPPKSA